MTLFVLVCSTATSCSRTLNHERSAKPNFVFIIADDMRKDDLKYMPKTRVLLGEKGMSFSRAFVSNPLCCPSRATIMRGQYAHNTGVWSNGPGPNGGWRAYKGNGNEQDNLPTRLQEGDYRTALIGKYLNFYHGTTVPPGWDKWFATFAFDYFDYDTNDNGTIRHFGTREGHYLTYVLRRQSLKFIDSSTTFDKPFFAYIAPNTPHGPSTASPRDRHSFDRETFTLPPSVDEEDVSDKPPWIRSLPRLHEGDMATIERTSERRAESLRALDDLVAGVVHKLRSVGALDDTYIVFTSDNGRELGEHRILVGKERPYEESIHMPLLVRGPGIEAGSATRKLVLNTDYFPTFTDLAGIHTPSYVDGRSLRPVFKGVASTWRNTILLEGHESDEPDVPDSESYYGVRTSNDTKYVEYQGGFKEYYDLKTDPDELHNDYRATTPLRGLASRLEALKTCSGQTCRAAENGQ
jgi:N-acetylglucosamine-6-sulfatase